MLELCFSQALVLWIFLFVVASSVLGRMALLFGFLLSTSKVSFFEEIAVHELEDLPNIFTCEFSTRVTAREQSLSDACV